MKPNRTIRVIKKGERGNQPEGTHAPAAGGETLRQATRDVATQVGTWVKEFQQRRRPDARRAFAGLFRETATPLGTLS